MASDWLELALEDRVTPQVIPVLVRRDAETGEGEIVERVGRDNIVHSPSQVVGLTIGALLSRLREAEAERDRLWMVLEALVGLVDQHNSGRGELPIAANTLMIARGLLRATASEEEADRAD